MGGVVLGVIVGWYRRIRLLLDPFLNALYATPRVAMVPLIIIWFGIGPSGKVFVVFISSFFPILVNTVAGIRTMDQDLLRAARAFCAMWRYSHNLDALYETPALAAAANINKARAEKIVDHARRERRRLLNEVESKWILAAYGIPVVQTEIATSENEAVDLAKKIGGAVVLKVFSETITHKSDMGGVKLNLRGASAVRPAA